MPTSIEYFNSTLKLFIENIIEIYPEHKNDLNEYYKELLEKDTSSEDKYIKRFVRKFQEHEKQISEKDVTLFDQSIFFLKNIDFKEIWHNEKTTDSLKENIWRYIQTLFIIGKTIMDDSDKIKDIMEQFSKVQDKDLELDDVESNNLALMLKNLSQNNDSQDNPLTGGLIGSLAKELSEEINLEDMNLNIDEDGNIGDVLSNLMNGDNNFMDLVQNVGSKIQDKITKNNIDENQLLSEAQNMMSLLGNNNPLFNDMLSKAKKEMAHIDTPPSNPTAERLRRKLQKRKQKK